jgi:DNA-binding MarR family transcriptional regulator
MFTVRELMNMDRADQQLRELIRIVIRNLGMLEKTVACCGITLAQCQAIIEIGRENIISLTDLADLLGLDKSTISRTINNLVQAGLVHRKQDDTNRRYVTIQLTDPGRKLYHDIEDGVSTYYQQILGAIEKGKQPQVNECLTLLLNAARKHNAVQNNE